MLSRRDLFKCFAGLTVAAALPAISTESAFAIVQGDFIANGCRISFTPHGEVDWIDMPSDIIGLTPHDDSLIISCIDSEYMLRGNIARPDTLFIRRIS